MEEYKMGEVKKVEIIEPIKKRKEQKKKLNVAAYARVSTGSEEQRDSFENQKNFYEEKIKSNADYNFVGVFADEAISGTTDKRPNFQRMIRLAERGQIDVILTKSISRFSRNVVDLLSYCERLKNHNVNLIFEENGIELLNSTGSLMLTILGAVAQMEVENTSDHINWTLKEKMKKGEFVGQPNPLGYDVVDGKLVVNEEEAEIVRYIFKRYLEGAGGSTIAKELEKMGVKTKRANNTVWHPSTVLGIIKNEKYTGELVQGKTYTVNPIGHKRKDNHGDAAMYKVQNNHEAIISLEDWTKAQEITNSRCISYVDGRKRGTTQNSNQSEFTSKIVCGYCGKNYVRRKIHAGSKYEKIVWNCTTVCKRDRANCPNCKPVEEDYIKQSVVGMIKDLIDSKEEMFYLSNEQLNKLLQKSDKEQDKLEEQILKCHRQLELKSKKKSKLLSLYVDEKITEEEFDLQRQTVEKEIQSIQELLNDLEEEIDYKDIKKNTSRQISKLISEGKAEGFNKELFDLLVNRIVVGGKRWSDGVDDPKSLHFELKDYNLSTDMTVVMDESGTPRYTMDSDMEETESENSSKKKQ
jgi:DNA invertase Pin-like site-specific DNA recombinase